MPAVKNQNQVELSLKKLETGLKSLDAIPEMLRKSLDSYIEESAILTDKKNSLMEEIASLTKDKQEQLRQFKVQLALDIKEEKNNAFQALGSDLGYAIISDGTYNSLLERIQELEKGWQKEESEAIKKLEKSQHFEKKAINDRHATEMASLTAQNEALEKQIEFYRIQLQRGDEQQDKWRDSLTQMTENLRPDVKITNEGKR